MSSLGETIGRRLLKQNTRHRSFPLVYSPDSSIAMTDNTDKRKVVVIGAGPVGALAALYAAVRGDDVEVYELRGGTLQHFIFSFQSNRFLIIVNAKLE